MGLAEIGKGEVCAPGNVTCKSAHGGRTIDDFIIDSRISHGVRGIWTQMDLPSSPHYLVVLRIEATATRTMIQKYVAPKSFEPRPATGCARQTVDEVSCLPRLENLIEGDVSKVFENIMSTAEKHLCRTFDCVEPDGAPCAAYMGRGFVSVRKSRRVMPLCAGEDGHADPYMIALSLVHLRFCELVALIQKC